MAGKRSYPPSNYDIANLSECEAGWTLRGAVAGGLTFGLIGAVTGSTAPIAGTITGAVIGGVGGFFFSGSQCNNRGADFDEHFRSSSLGDLKPTEVAAVLSERPPSIDIS